MKMPSEQPDLYYRTTERNAGRICLSRSERGQGSRHRRSAGDCRADVPDLKPFPDGSFPPIIASAADDVRQHDLGDRPGDVWPRRRAAADVVQERIERELRSIIDNGFAVMYYIAHQLVQQIQRRRLYRRFARFGRLIAGRDPLRHHRSQPAAAALYLPELPPSASLTNPAQYGSGYDLPAKDCPVCGTALTREGQDIPFETFLGFNGDKQPDIDLNFSGEYQARAHKFIEEMFGSSHTFRAGTIGGYAEKNAQAMVAELFQGNRNNSPPRLKSAACPAA